MTQAIDWQAISPPLCLLTGAVLALLVDTFAPKRRAGLPIAVCLTALIVGLGLIAWLGSGSPHNTFCLPSSLGEPADCSWGVDDVTVTWWLLIVGATAFVALMSHGAVASGELPAGEFFFLLLTSATGALCLAASRDLLTLLVSMETVSLPAFALVGLRRGHRHASEAALKFFISSITATAFTLLGISLVYGATGSVTATAVARSVANGTAVVPVAEVGMVLTMVALAFKVAVVPFQAWVPDTYVGGPVPVAAYLSVVSKVAGLAGLMIITLRFFPGYVDTWSTLLGVAAALTMTVGNLAALRQRHLVRLLAWSSVAQAGYLLVPLAAGGTPADVGALQAYALMYGLVNMGAFAVVTTVTSWGAVEVADVVGLARRSPWLGSALAFALLCLAGLPPGIVGLLAKVVIFQSAVDGQLGWLAAIMAVNVAIGLVYYLRVLVAVVSPVPDQVGVHTRPMDWPTALVVGGTMAAAVAFSVVPGPIFAAIP